MLSGCCNLGRYADKIVQWNKLVDIDCWDIIRKKDCTLHWWIKSIIQRSQPRRIADVPIYFSFFVNVCWVWRVFGNFVSVRRVIQHTAVSWLQLNHLHAVCDPLFQLWMHQRISTFQDRLYVRLPLSLTPRYTFAQMRFSYNDNNRASTLQSSSSRYNEALIYKCTHWDIIDW